MKFIQGVYRKSTNEGQKGFSLVEVMITSVVVIIGLLGVSALFVGNSQMIFTTKKISKSNQDLILLHTYLYKFTNRLFYKPLFINDQIIDLAISPQADIVLNTGAVASILPSQNYRILRSSLELGQLRLVPAASDHLLLFMLGPERGTEILVREDPARPEIPYDFSDPETTRGRLFIEGDVSRFARGDLVTISTAEGVQVVRVRVINNAQLQFETLGYVSVGESTETRMPLGLIPQGAIIQKLQAYVLGVDDRAESLIFARILPNGRVLPLVEYHRGIEYLRLMKVDAPTERHESDLIPLSQLGLLDFRAAPDGVGMSGAPLDFEFVF